MPAIVVDAIAELLATGDDTEVHVIAISGTHSHAIMIVVVFVGGYRRPGWIQAVVIEVVAANL